MEQLSLFGLLPVRVDDVPCGWIEDYSLVGKRIQFPDLKNRIGKKVVMYLGYGQNYRVVKIVKFIDDCDAVYVRTRPLPESDIGYGMYVNSYVHDICGIKECMDCYELAYHCSRVLYTDSDKKDTGFGVSEMYCLGGRHEPIISCPEEFFELNVL